MTSSVNQLREQILAKRPILREVLAKRGTKSVLEYTVDYTSVYMNPPIQSRQEEFIALFQDQVRLQLGEDIAQSVAQQLRKYYFVSTADHHGPICHPYFLNSNLAITLPITQQADPILQNVIVLACANVSLDNDSFPRGLLFHGVDAALCRVPFFSSHERPPLVNLLRAYGEPELAKANKAIASLGREHKISTEQADRLTGLISEIYHQPDVLAGENYSRQITKTNFQLWKKFFQSSTITPPNLVYLEMEDLVAKLLIQHHLLKDTIINHHLFDDVYHELTLKYFDGIMGAFSTVDRIGTYLFWALPAGGRYRIQLWKKGNYLVSEDGQYSIELTPAALQQALESKELIPGLMLIFVVLSFYYGLKCLGGFNQINYLTAMKNAYIKVQIEFGNYRSIEVCARAQTKEINDGMTLAFLQTMDKALIPATGIDLLLYGTTETWSAIMQTAKHLSLNEALDPLMPERYRVVYPETERTPELATLTAKDIVVAEQLDKKIIPCVTLN